MLKVVLKWLEQKTDYHKVELRVIATNERAIHLYRKIGFIEEARLRRELKFSEEDYRDDVIMSLFFKRFIKNEE